MTRALLVVAKEPIPGRVKTRLGGLFSPAITAEFYRSLLLDTLHLMRQTPDVTCGIAYTPAEARVYFEELASPGFMLLPQRGPDLGERLLHAFEDLLAQGFERVVIMNSDSPTLPAPYLEDAFRRLDENDVVFGPSVDGGYYLVGAGAANATLFRDIQMSTSTVLAETLARAEAACLSVSLLPAWFDVDVPEDVARLRGRTGEEWPARGAHATVFRAAPGGEVRMAKSARIDAGSPWDVGARAFAEYADAPAGRLRFQLIADTLERHLPPAPLRVLDAGCGVGEMAVMLAGRGDVVTAVDASAEMLCVADERAGRLGPAARARLHLERRDLFDAASAWPADSFDLILVHTLLDYLPAPADRLADLLNWLRAGGLISLVRVNRVSLVLRSALNRHDFAGAERCLADATLHPSLFGVCGVGTTLTEAGEELARAGVDVVATYGIRAVADYLPAGVRDDPAQYETLLRLERAVCGQSPYREMARYIHLIGVKRLA